MSKRYEKAQSRLAISVVAGFIFFVMFASQLGGGPNTGGVFPAPLLIGGLLGLPVCALFFLVSLIQVFLYRNDRPDVPEKREEPNKQPENNARDVT